MQRGELLGIEDRGIEFGIHLNIRIRFAEHLFAVDVQLNSRCHPACRQLPVIHKPRVGGLAVIVTVRLNQTQEQQPLFLLTASRRVAVVFMPRVSHSRRQPPFAAVPAGWCLFCHPILSTSAATVRQERT